MTDFFRNDEDRDDPIAALNRLTSTSEQNAWIVQNYTSLPPDRQREVDIWVEARGGHRITSPAGDSIPIVPGSLTTEPAQTERGHGAFGPDTMIGDPPGTTVPSSARAAEGPSPLPGGMALPTPSAARPADAPEPEPTRRTSTRTPRGRGRTDDRDTGGPDPTNPDEIFAHLRELGPEQGIIWLEQNVARMPPNVQDDVDAWVGTQGDEWADAAPVTTAAADRSAAEEQVGSADWQNAVEAAADELLPSFDLPAGAMPPDIDDEIAVMMPEGLSPAAQEQFRTEVEADLRAKREAQRAAEIRSESGVDEDTARELASQEVDSQFSLFGTSTPHWIMNFNQGDLSPVEKQRFVDYWNDAYGTTFHNFDQLIPLLEQQGETAEMQNFVSSVVADQEPLISHAIELPLVSGTRRLNYTEEELATLRQMGFSNDGILRLTRLAGILGGEEALEPTNLGETVNVAALAGIVRFHGGGEEFGRMNELHQEVNQLEQFIGLRPGQYRNMTAEQRTNLRKRLEAAPGIAGTVARRRLAAMDKIERLFAQEARIEERGVHTNVIAANNMYRRGIETYNGDPVMAMLHSFDAGLAARIAASGGDLAELDGNDNALALRYMRRAGMLEGGSTFFDRLGGNIGNSVMRYLTFFDTAGGAQPRGGGGAGGAGPQRRVLDPVAVAERVRQQWGEWFLADPTQEVIDAIHGQLQAELDKADPGMNFDWTARVTDWLRGRGEHKELYGRKPEGMSEDDYRMQFVSGAADMLGAEAGAAQDAVRAGMETGQYQTTVGTVFGTREFQDFNSRLRQRLAIARDTFGEMT